MAKMQTALRWGLPLRPRFSVIRLHLSALSWALSGSAPLQGLKGLPDPNPYWGMIWPSPCPTVCQGANRGTWSGGDHLAHVPWLGRGKGMAVMWDTKTISQYMQSFHSEMKEKL